MVNDKQRMIAQKQRMIAYETAINQLAKDKVIIDVGAGTGILSMLAIKAGAQQVYAVENSDIAKVCMQAVKDNNLQNQIAVFQQLAEEVEIPVNKVDLIISEWMGYFLIYENMLPSVIKVRQKYLKEVGLIIPYRARLYIAAVEKNNKLLGLNFQSIRRSQMYKALPEIIQKECILSDYCKIFDIDLKKSLYNTNNFESDFNLKVLRDAKLNAFVSWFTTDLTENISLFTSPFDPDTHWKQTIFTLNDNYDVIQGQEINGFIQVCPQKDNYRALKIKISYKTSGMNKSKEQSYDLD